MQPLKAVQGYISSFRALGRPYHCLFTAGVLSDVGGFTTQTALTLHVYKLSGERASFMGITAIATILPMFFGALVGGVWAERYNRKRIMIVNDIIRAPLVLLMMATSHIWTILALQSVICASTAFFMPSRQSIIPQLVKKEQVHLANSINGGILSLVHVLGPVLGAGTYALTGTMAWIVGMNAATYTASAVLLALIVYRPAPRAEAAGAPSFLRELYAGIQYVRSKSDLKTILTMIVMANAAMGLVVPLLRPFIKEILGGGDRTYALIIFSFGLGGLIGPITGYWAGRLLGYGRTITYAFFVEATLLLVFSRIRILPISCVLLFFWGVNIFTMIPCYMSYIHTYADKLFQGRTFALFDQSAYSVHVAGAVVIMAIGDRFAARSIVTTAGALYVIIFLLAVSTPGGRLLRSRRGEPERKHAPEPAVLASDEIPVPVEENI